MSRPHAEKTDKRRLIHHDRPVVWVPLAGLPSSAWLIFPCGMSRDSCPHRRHVRRVPLAPSMLCLSNHYDLAIHGSLATVSKPVEGSSIATAREPRGSRCPNEIPSAGYRSATSAGRSLIGVAVRHRSSRPTPAFYLLPRAATMSTSRNRS